MSDPVQHDSHSVTAQCAQRILVTGASGFIGRALLPALSAQGHRVTTAPWRLGLESSSGREEQSNALAGCDQVIHLAAKAHYRAAGRSLQSLRAVNVDATTALAKQAREAGVKRLIFLSSIGVLGLSSHAPLDESAPLAPTEPYAQSKAEAEFALWALADQAMAVTVIRPPLVHGPGAPGNFGRLLDWAHEGRPLPLAALTHNRRSLLGLHNLIDFICHVVVSPRAPNETFHVADRESISTASLFSILARRAGREPRLFRVPSIVLRGAARLVGRAQTAERLLGSLTVDSGKAQRLLGWHPPWTLEQGLTYAVANHQDALK